MEVCIAAGRLLRRDLEREREPQGFLSLFFVDCERAALWTPVEADLFVLPVSLYLDLPEGVRPLPVFAYGREGLMAEAFRQGCSDFLREPWSFVELAARAQRILVIRLKIGESILELSGRRIRRGDTWVSLTEFEYRLLRILALNLNRVVPRASLCYALWGERKEKSRAPDVCVSELRRKLDILEPGLSRMISTRRGFGYLLEGECCG